MPRELRLGGGGLGGGEGVRARVELVVAVELEHGAAEGVRPRLGHDVHLAGGASELRGVDAGLHLELFQRVDRRQEDVGIEIDVGVVDAVERVVVELAALAGNGDLLVGARTALAVARLAGTGEAGADVRAQGNQAQDSSGR